MMDEVSNALPSRFYRDPASHVRFESEKCNGCKWEHFSVVGSVMWCGLGDAEGKNRKWGIRCNEFSERGGE